MRKTDDTLTKRTATCPHRLVRWMIRTTKSTATYPDGAARPDEHRGGRLARQDTGCVFVPGHAGEHRAEDGRAW